VAALMVLVLHVGMTFLQAPGIKAQGDGLLTFLEVIDLGRIGITIFFLISGFVICKSIAGPKRLATRQFLIKRFYRLFPLFWFSLFSGVFFIWHLSGQHVTPMLVVANLTMVPAFFGQEFIIGLYWTLETELIFYALIVLLFLLGALKKPIILVLLTFLFYGLLWLFSFSTILDVPLPHWRSTPYHLSLMIYGIIVRYWFDQRSKKLAARSSSSLRSLFLLQTATICLVPLAVFYKFGFSPQTEFVSDAIAYILGISFFFAGLYFWKNPAPVFSYLGRISYSLYLMHPVVFYTVWQIIQKNPLLDHWHISIYITICMIFSIGVSHLTYTFIERPFNNRGHRKAKALAAEKVK
jgi:peptidoglycan/LPS O-acetylase OafA/YrhL